MNLNHFIKVSCIGLGLAAPAFAGSEVEPAQGDHQPWTVEASLLYMYSEGQGEAAHFEGQDHEVGYRVMLGYQPTADSWAYSLTYTDYEGTVTDEAGPDFYIFDFDVTTATRSCGQFDYNFMFGLRYMDLLESYSSGIDVDYEGWGPTVGIAATCDLPGAFSLYGSASYGMLFGNDDEEEVPDETYTWQAEAGVRYDTNCGAYLKLGYEFQHYEDMSYTSEDFSVDGFVFSIGYAF